VNDVTISILVVGAVILRPGDSLSWLGATTPGSTRS